MPHPIRIIVNDLEFNAELNDSDTAQLLADELPFEGTASRWGDEYYFSTAVAADEDRDATSDFEVGDLAFWPPGSAFCLLFGPTPASTGLEPRTASPANPIGRIVDDIDPLLSLGGSVRICVEDV